jgi:carboxymethylenebutenolidase
MKKFLIIIPLMLLGLVCLAQEDITICHTSSTDKFAMFASNKDFNAVHSAPRSYVHVSAAGGTDDPV